MKGLRLGNERVSSSFFILQCFKEHLFDVAKIQYWQRKIFKKEGNYHCAAIISLFYWSYGIKCLILCLILLTVNEIKSTYEGNKSD